MLVTVSFHIASASDTGRAGRRVRVVSTAARTHKCPYHDASNMFGARRDREEETVTCIACGTSLERSKAREYDKHGDRWDRTDKEFEYLCKPCYRDCCHQPRDGLEEMLVEVDAGESGRDEFLAAFADATEEREGRVE